MYKHTQYGGLRPFGVSFLYAVWDKYHGFQLYHSDPSGNYFGWRAHCIGNNNQSAQSILKQDYKDDMTLEAAKTLAVKILAKTMESSSLDAEKLEFAILHLDKSKKLVYKILSKSEIETLLKEHEPDAAAPSASS